MCTPKGWALVLRCAAGKGSECLCLHFLLLCGPVISMPQMFSEFLPGLGAEGRSRPLTLCDTDRGSWHHVHRGADRGSKWGGHWLKVT